MIFEDIIKKITDCVFPIRCAICDEPVVQDELICVSCRERVKIRYSDTCQKCGKYVNDSDKIFCFDCSRKIHEFDRGFSIFEYQQIKSSLYRFKYSGRAEYARYYAQEGYNRYKDMIAKLEVDALIPVPIHKSRKRERGYNQAYILAKELSRLSGIPVVDNFIIRKKATIPLKFLDEKGRVNNLKKAFTMGSNSVKLRTIIVIDDIYTTGATIDEISRLCRRAGVINIYFLTVASGKGL